MEAAAPSERGAGHFCVSTSEASAHAAPVRQVMRAGEGRTRGSDVARDVAVSYFIGHGARRLDPLNARLGAPACLEVDDGRADETETMTLRLTSIGRV